MFLKFKKIISNLFSRTSLKISSGGFLGYFTGDFFGGEEIGEAGRLGSLIFNIGDYRFHFHHWLISLVILIFIFLPLVKKNKLNPFLSLFFFGFLSGLILQGIYCYSDWRQVLVKIK